MKRVGKHAFCVFYSGQKVFYPRRLIANVMARPLFFQSRANLYDLKASFPRILKSAGPKPCIFIYGKIQKNVPSLRQRLPQNRRIVPLLQKQDRIRHMGHFFIRKPFQNLLFIRLPARNLIYMQKQAFQFLLLPLTQRAVRHARRVCDTTHRLHAVKGQKKAPVKMPAAKSRRPDHIAFAYDCVIIQLRRIQRLLRICFLTDRQLAAYKPVKFFQPFPITRKS